MKYKLERTYGPGLRDLHDENGKVIVERLGWANKITQKLKGSVISVDLGVMTIDAGSDNAFWLGFTQGMNYSLKTDAAQTTEVQLSNCFASAYGLLENIDVAAYNYQTIF